jgi:TPR repeat protein
LNVFVQIENRKREIIREFRILSFPPAITILEDALGKLEWVDESKLRVTHSNGRDYWLIDLEKGTCEFVYPRADAGDPHGQFQLGLLYLEGRYVPRDRERALYWIRQSAAQKFAHAVKRLRELEGSESAS